MTPRCASIRTTPRLTAGAATSGSRWATTRWQSRTTTSLLIDPGPIDFYAYRGQAHLILGRSIAGARGGDNVARIFEADAARVDLAIWPGQIVQYFLGDLSKDDLRQAAEAGADGINRICDYDLYVGLGALLFDDNFAAAPPMFQQAELDCQPNSMADRLAKAELARMPR